MLNDIEKKMLHMFINKHMDIMGNNGCNDLEQEFIEMLSKEEWVKINKEYHDMNGDPEEASSKYPILPDFCLLHYLLKKL